jgi:hypothetical protein
MGRAGGSANFDTTGQVAYFSCAIDFFRLLFCPSPPSGSSLFLLFVYLFKKWKTHSTALLASISVLPTRKYPHSIVVILLTSFLSCVGVWQNDRVEIIANDRKILCCTMNSRIYLCVLQRATGQLLHMSHSLRRSV